MTRKTKSWLVELDLRRLDEPEEVALELEGASSKIRKPLHPLFCAVYGSTLRRLGRIEESILSLHRGVELCHDRQQLANLIQRLAFAIGESDLKTALRCTELAKTLYEAEFNLTGLGQANVDKGVWLFRKGNYQEAICANRLALMFLPDEEQHAHSRFAAILGQGFCYEALGDLKQAFRFAEAASEIESTVGSGLQLSLWRLKARLARQLGKLADSENVFSKIVDYYTEKEQPLFAAQAAVELVAVQLELGKTPQAIQTAKQMAVYLTPLKKNPVATAAIIELIRSSFNGNLTLSFVEAAKAALEKEQGTRKTSPLKK